MDMELDNQPVLDAELLDDHDVAIQSILEDYRQQKLKEHLVGPVVSFVLHAVVLLALAMFVVGRPTKEPLSVIEVTMEEPPIKEIQEREEEELEPMDDEVMEEAVMEVDVPFVDETITESALEDVSEEVPEIGDNFEIDELLEVMPRNSPLQMLGTYSGRTPQGRATQREKFGGKKAGSDAVLKALRWLKSVQDSEGKWENEAFTGLALLCFLAHGETPASEEFGETVQKAMQYLAAHLPVEGGSSAYKNGIATYAISEAYAMTKIPFLRGPMEAGLTKIVKGQQGNGGYGYDYNLDTRWDLSVAGWQYQAMKAGYYAQANVPGLPEAIEKSKTFLKNVAYANKKFGYSSPGSGGNMTGVGTVALQLLGESNSPQARGGVETIYTERLAGYDWASAGGNLYGWYYDTQAMFNTQGPEWKRWNAKFQKVLIRNQDSQGSWTVNIHGQPKVFATTLACLQLEVYYRYLPMNNLFGGQEPKGRTAKKPKGLLEDQDDELEGLIIQ
jgi:hypothetical protein